jgi:hypothetical protein
MASEKQIAANRANSKRSTGPKTNSAKRRTSRNALRHGFARAVSLDDNLQSRVAEIVSILIGSDALPVKRAAAIGFAHAFAELLMIRDRRSKMGANMSALTDLELWRVAALDRYERRALTRRKRAEVELGI